MSQRVLLATLLVSLAALSLLGQPAESLARPIVDLPRDESPDELRLSANVIMRLAPVRAGTFLMGTREAGDEVLHEVEITQPFHIGIHEVTRGQFRAFVEATGHVTERQANGAGGNGFDLGTMRTTDYQPKYSWLHPGYVQTDTHPVVNVTYDDALAFCAWLGRKTRRTVDLPTEAEWEYACRAGTKTQYFCGDDSKTMLGFANTYDLTAGQFFGSKAATCAIEDGHVFTAPVGSYKANPWGLFDMQGNVNELCKDWYGPYPAVRAVDPQGPDDGKERVVRGGSWGCSPGFARSACRSCRDPHGCDHCQGFRVVVRPGT